LGLGEAAEFGKLIEAYVKVVEVSDFEARVRALEVRRHEAAANAARTPGGEGPSSGP
jgi:hypothetical protein